MPDVDGAVAAVPTADRDAFKPHAEAWAPIFRELGALSVVECWCDDLPDGEVTSVPMAVQCTPGETVVFSRITWPSRALRDTAMAQMMEELPAAGLSHMPCGGKRMIMDGVDVIVES